MTGIIAGWKWWCRVNSDDPIRVVLNQGLAIILACMFPLALLVMIATASVGGVGFFQTLGAIPTILIIWWLNRRDTAVGAALLVFSMAIAIFTVFEPDTFFVGP